MNRHTCKQIAEDTLSIFKKGFYISSDRRKVMVNDLMERAVNDTILFTPRDVTHLSKTISPDKSYNTVFKVENTTTLSAAEAVKNEDKVLALNFASAKNPGGGFLKGSNAQEESLARSSGLFLCLDHVPEYYRANRECGTCLYTDHMIYSPQVPVIRNDAGTLLSGAYLLSFLTTPAVNAGAVRRNEPHNISKIVSTMRLRADYLLAVSAHKGYKVLILGAWGCGVFKNEPDIIAKIFADLLKADGAKYGGVFKKVIFAVLDRFNSGIISPFEKRFS